MALTGSILLCLLVLIASGNCAPATLFDVGGTLGYESTMNGTLGGHLKAKRDGLSVNATGNAIIGASWAPTLIAKGHAQAFGKTIAGDASLKTVIDNNWQPGFQGELGRNSKGEWLAGFVPNSVLNNKFVITPKATIQTGEDAKKLAGLPVDPKPLDKNVPPQNPWYGAPGPYMPVNPYQYGYPYGYNPYGYNYGYYNPGYGQNQWPQMPQTPQQQVPQPQVPQIPQQQVPESQVPQIPQTPQQQVPQPQVPVKA